MMRYGTIAGGEKTTVTSAYQILESGGNAFDAAVAAVFTSMVSEYNLTGPGGGGIMLASPINSKTTIFDFFVDTPPPQPDKDLDFFGIDVDFGPSTQEFHIGQGSVAIPGNIAGLLHVQKRLGKLELKDVLEPSIEAAKNGVIINDAQAYIIKILEPVLTNTKGGLDLFKPNNHLLKEGDLFLNPAFADFLECLAIDGQKYFYDGPGTDLILDTVGHKGLITRESLKNYRVIEREPLIFKFKGKTIYTNPPPSVGGSLISFLLKMLNYPGINLSPGSADLVKAMQITSIARKEICNDPQNTTLINEILSPEILKHYQKIFRSGSIDVNRDAHPFSQGATTHVSILDKDGNAASVTTTNGEGCGYLIPENGIMLNNMLGEEDLNPNGFHLWDHQQRLPTMMAPTIVKGDKGVELVLGSGGSNRIRSAISQVIINVINNKMDLETAIHNPRIHLESNILHFEPGIELDELPKQIQLQPWDENNLFFGGVNAVSPTDAWGDDRRAGAELAR